MPHPKFKTGGGGGADHNILDGDVHLDSILQAVTRGSLIYGNSTPAWDELVIGGARSYLGSDGVDAAWKQSFSYVLVADGADATSPADTLDNTLKSVSIPANSLGANGRIRVYCIVKSTGTNNTKTYRIKFGATTLFSFVDGATSESRYEFNLNIFNRNLTNSQYAWFMYPYNNAAANTDTFASISRHWNTSAIDTTSAQTLAVTGQLANSLDSIIISGFYVEILRT